MNLLKRLDLTVHFMITVQYVSVIENNPPIIPHNVMYKPQ